MTISPNNPIRPFAFALHQPITTTPALIPSFMDVGGSSAGGLTVFGLGSWKFVVESRAGRGGQAVPAEGSGVWRQWGVWAWRGGGRRVGYVGWAFVSDSVSVGCGGEREGCMGGQVVGKWVVRVFRGLVRYEEGGRLVGG